MSWWSNIPLKSYQRKTVLRGHEIHSSIIIYKNTSIISIITLLQVIWHLTCFGADFFSLQGAMFVLPKIPSGAADKSPSRLFCPLREGKQRVAGESTVYYSILCLTYYFILGKINYSSLRKDYESSRDWHFFLRG